MKRLFTTLIALILLGNFVINQVTLADAAEIEQLTAEFAFRGTELQVNIDCYEMQGGKFVVQYNPEVLEIEAMSEAGFSSGWKVLEPGKAEFHYEDIMQLGGYYTSIFFAVIGHGSTDVSIESVCVYDNEDTYEIEPNIDIMNAIYTPHAINWDENSKSLYVGKANENMGGAIQPESLIQYHDIAEKLVFEEGLTEITCDCFRDFSALDDVVIPSTVINISEGVFRGVAESNVDFQITGQAGSFAEEYALENGLKFVSTNDLLCGDINGNGVYEAEDALGILKMVVKLEPTNVYTADANADGEVTAEDALKVLRKVVGLE